MLSTFSRKRDVSTFMLPVHAGGKPLSSEVRIGFPGLINKLLEMNVVYFGLKTGYLISLFPLGCCSQIFGPWSCRGQWLIYRWRGWWVEWCVSLASLLFLNLFFLHLINELLISDTLTPYPSSRVSPVFSPSSSLRHWPSPSFFICTKSHTLIWFHCFV